MTKPIDFPQTENSQEEREGTGTEKRSAIKRVTYGGLLLFLFMLLYIPSLLNWLSGKHITRDVIRNGIIESYIQTNAVIIRDEELLEPSGITGRCIPEIPEGGRTASFSRIAMITNDTSSKLISDMEKINAKIVKARLEQAEKADFFSEDLNRLDDEIAHEIQDLIQACNSRDFAMMARYRNNIVKIVEKKAEIIGVNSTDSYISSLIREKENIQAKINANTVEVRSNISGIVSYVIDGYESVLTPKNIENLKVADLKKIIEREAEGNASDDKVQVGTPFAKIIKGTDIYIAAAIPSEYASNYEEKARIALRINNIGLETTGTITKIIPSDEDQVIVVLQISRGVDVLSATRVINVDFINKTEEGLKVPLKSLWDISADGTKGKIMLIKYNVATVREVAILCRDEEYAIISTPEDEYDKTVNLYDTYIMNPDNIMEGEIIDK